MPERVDGFQALDQFLTLVAVRVFQFFNDDLVFFLNINLFQQGLDRFRAGLGDKAARTVQCGVLTVFFF